MNKATGLMVGLLLAGCSFRADPSLAERAVPQFHRQLDAGDFAAIYDAADSELQSQTPRQAFISRLDAVHRKLGKTQSADRQSIEISHGLSSTLVTLKFRTTYAQGEAIEQFVYRLQGGQAALDDYHVDAPALKVP